MSCSSDHVYSENNPGERGLLKKLAEPNRRIAYNSTVHWLIVLKSGYMAQYGSAEEPRLKTGTGSRNEPSAVANSPL